MDIPQTDRLSQEWWELVAHRAVAFFGNNKEEFTSWVNSSYGSDENRFLASVCWDIVRLGGAE